MAQRGLLRSHLKKAWRTAIADRYNDNLINSERGLQFYFCEALLRIFHEAGVNRTLFIEPLLKLHNGTSHRYPDVVICNSRRIIGIVEIKYAPRARPANGLTKDLETLSFAVQQNRKLVISNNRYLGEAAAPKAYPLAKDAVLCWAGIYRGDKIDVRGLIKEKRVLPHFLQLDALTCQGSRPTVVVS